ncbi:MAG: hypothetical protein J5486_10465 [Bacteroidaceae bacterium]|nr:hypothetical protein [Bacteroidaceae bacterium]
MKTNSIITILTSAALLTLTACGGGIGGSKAPLAALEDVYLDGVERGEGCEIEDWQQRAADLKEALEGQEIEVEVADPEESPFSIEQPFTVARVKDDPNDGWLPAVELQGTIISDEPNKILHEQLGYLGILNVTLYGIDDDGLYHLVGPLKFTDDGTPFYNEETNEIRLTAKLGAEHINVSNEIQWRRIAHCTRFVMTYDPLPSAKDIKSQAEDNDRTSDED